MYVHQTYPILYMHDHRTNPNHFQIIEMVSKKDVRSEKLKRAGKYIPPNLLKRINRLSRISGYFSKIIMKRTGSVFRRLTGN